MEIVILVFIRVHFLPLDDKSKQDIFSHLIANEQNNDKASRPHF